MAKRRRGPREIPFSLDCFVDVITNLVGIVLRLMLLVMMGALLLDQSLPKSAGPAMASSVAPDPVQDPEVQDCQAEIAALTSQVVELLQSQEALKEKSKGLQARRQELNAEIAAQTRLVSELSKQFDTAKVAGSQVQDPEAEVQSLRQRLASLHEAVAQLRDRPPERKSLQLHLPVSKPIGMSELIFECRSGRVTFADLTALLELVREAMPSKVKDLQTRWEVTDMVGPGGPFQLKYTIGRERSSIVDEAFGDSPPLQDRGFRYGLVRWELVPTWSLRGETAEEAIAEGSRLRQIVDELNPDQVALTFFVYPDSFAAFRRLRDYLYERGFVVAGRPMVPEASIIGSPKGSISRAQ